MSQGDQQSSYQALSPARDPYNQHHYRDPAPERARGSRAPQEEPRQHRPPDREPVRSHREDSESDDRLRNGDHHHHHPYYEKHTKVYPLPSHVYNRYTDEAAEEHAKGLTLRQSLRDRQKQGAGAGPGGSGEFTTLYIPHVRETEGGKTLIRRRRTSSKRHTSSKRRQYEREHIDDLLGEEDNHLLPSLRFQRRLRMKSLKDRKVDLQDERKEDEEGPDNMMPSLKDRYNSMKERDEMTAGNFAIMLRDSTLTRIQKLGTGEKMKRKTKDVVKRKSREFFEHFNLWINSFKEIENVNLETENDITGKFGTAAMSYFMFVRWLLFLNIFMMVIMFFVITVPFLALTPYEFDETVDATKSAFHFQAVNCSAEYVTYNNAFKDQETTFEKVLDFLIGTGWMERTVLFYGNYYNKTYYVWDTEGKHQVTYNMPLAYLLAIGTCFIASFLLIIKNSAAMVKSTFGIQSAVAVFSNRVFAGWDYAISNKKASEVKKANLHTEFMDSLSEERMKLRRDQRSSREMVRIVLIRVLVNLLVLVILAGALFLVYYTTDKLLELQKNQDLHEIVALIVQYLPYLTITILNFAVPLFFQKIVLLEEYSHSFNLTITLGRSICLRLASLGVLIGSLYRLLIIDRDPEDGFCGNRRWSESVNSTSGSIKCWESYVGQQLYKLVLLDLIVETSIVVFLMFPRRLLYDHYGSRVKLIKKIGPQQFDLPQCVIDIIYSQTLCWLGMIFSPLIPFMAFVKTVIFFYLRKWMVLRTCSPSDERFRTSRSHSLFMFVLLFSFILTCVPVGYMISSIPPSQSCGPFRVYSSSTYHMFDIISNTIASWPIVLKDIIQFLGTVGFLIPVIILLLLSMYYFWLLGQGYKKREKMLQAQLKLEAKDKTFLLDRVNEVLLSSSI